MGAAPSGRFAFHVTPASGKDLRTRTFEAETAAGRDAWVKALCRARQVKKW